MKQTFRLLLAASAALACGSSHAQTAPANGHAIQPRMTLPASMQRAVPAQRAHFAATDTPETNPGDALPTAFTLNGIAFLPLLVQRDADGSDWYVQWARYPDGSSASAKIMPAEELAGLQLSTTAASGYPIVFFAPTAPATPPQADHQSAMIGVFNQLYGEAMGDLLARGASARARAPGTRKRATKADGNEPDDPEPAPFNGDTGGTGGGGGGGGITTVEVPGIRPPADPGLPWNAPYQPPPQEPGGGGGNPPNGTPWNESGNGELSSPSGAICTLMPTPGGPPAAACVTVPGVRPPLTDPEMTALPPAPPPAWDWCAKGNICNATNFPPPDPRKYACDSKQMVDAAVCIRERALGHKTRDQYRQCIDVSYANRAKCRATLGQVRAATR